jgi:hypothetical protein
VTLPDFLVIGAYKSGTTALHDDLRAHPELFVPSRKEPNFFAFAGRAPEPNHPAAGKSVLDQDRYEALFADRGDAVAAGEVSPEYLANPHACAAIRRLVPEARLVAVLRNPVERAYSDYLMYRRDGLEPEADFERAIDQQDARAARGDPTGFYLRTGRYAEQLEPYLATFPREQLHIVLYEDLRSAREATLSGIFEFLGVSSDVAIPDAAPVNVSGEPSNPAVRAAYAVRRRVAARAAGRVPPWLTRAADRVLQRGLTHPELSPESRARLGAYYRDDVERLARLLDRDLGHWLAPATDPSAT